MLSDYAGLAIVITWCIASHCIDASSAREQEQHQEHDAHGTRKTLHYTQTRTQRTDDQTN